ncbi:phosphotransferase family protein [Aspergillus ellipticus CBS 707.79]|uniref:Phosphotransferase family protein n=1 Tax=Aspergillus ellipticus CBS 707.79 TaxID=1448320 RepID=A0A319EGD2_9EURO|nr:phosphotransferase family protein [Aspergillus ellipticus CBS 707.79]
MSPDDMAWEQSEVTSDNWLVQFLERDIMRPIADFVLKHNSGHATEFATLKKGSFNISLRMKYRKEAIVIRFAQPGAVFFPEEKVSNEVAVMRFIVDQTAVPVPFVLHSGTKQESPLELSPFFMMDFVEHETKMYNALNTPDCPGEQRGTLDPNIDESRLEMLYGEMGDILLRLFTLSLPRIGSLTQVDDFSWEVARRPLSMNMNELIRLGESADDCRRKFVARRLFRKLAREKRLTNPPFENGPFKMWCDDLRPANVLLNERMKIVGVVDWKFTYAAPVEFSLAPPWWLLIEQPESWPNGIDDWTKEFDRRLKTFLKAMRGCEDATIQHGRLKTDQRLSGHMQQSWDSGDFWIMYAALHSFAFDAIYWQKIDPRFFESPNSPTDAWKERLNLLDAQEKDEMEQLVAQKMYEMNNRALSWDPDDYTVGYRQQLKRKIEEAKKAKAAADNATKTEKKIMTGEEFEARTDEGKIPPTDTISDSLATTHLSN